MIPKHDGSTHVPGLFLFMRATCSSILSPVMLMLFFAADQYELIAQLPSSQLRHFTIFCSVCKRDTEVNKNTVCDGSDEKLRRMARDTLLERMQTLVQTCRHSTTHQSRERQLDTDDDDDDDDTDDDDREGEEEEEEEKTSASSGTSDYELSPRNDPNRLPNGRAAPWNLPQVIIMFCAYFNTEQLFMICLIAIFICVYCMRNICFLLIIFTCG